jgi:hypothetical protein
VLEPGSDVDPEVLAKCFPSALDREQSGVAPSHRCDTARQLEPQVLPRRMLADEGLQSARCVTRVSIADLGGDEAFDRLQLQLLEGSCEGIDPR